HPEGGAVPSDTSAFAFSSEPRQRITAMHGRTRHVRSMGNETDRDWYAWHHDYDDPDTALAQRLAAVQAQVRTALDAAPPGPLHAVSLCAGQGRDLIGVLADHSRRADVLARLV